QAGIEVEIAVVVVRTASAAAVGIRDEPAIRALYAPDGAVGQRGVPAAGPVVSLNWHCRRRRCKACSNHGRDGSRQKASVARTGPGGLRAHEDSPVFLFLNCDSHVPRDRTPPARPATLTESVPGKQHL